MEDELANDLMSEFTDLEEDKMAYTRIYIKNLLKILPSPKVLKLFQVENKIESAIRYELSMEVPFVKMSDKE